MKVYVVIDDRFPDPESVFTKKKHAIRFVQDNPQCGNHLKVYKYKVQDKYSAYEAFGGERVVTDPSSY